MVTVKKLPYSWSANNGMVELSIADNNKITAEILFVFQRRVVASTTNEISNITLITIKKAGAVELPSKSVTEDATDNMYDAIPIYPIILLLMVIYV
jgi:hypothetical protein